MTTRTLPFDGARGSLWDIAAPLVVWFLHFVLCYVIVALRCGKYAASVGTAVVHTALATSTLIAFVAIGLSAAGARSVGAREAAEDEFEDDSADEARRFIRAVTLLIGAVSAVAVLYTVITLGLLRGCR